MGIFLDRGLAEDLKKTLKQMSYSERAVKEILKWYGSNASKVDERL